METVLEVKNLSKSFEDYLEAIYILKNNKKIVRVKDVADNLSVSLPSVNIAIKKLDNKNLVLYKKYREGKAVLEALSDAIVAGGSRVLTDKRGHNRGKGCQDQ